MSDFVTARFYERNIPKDGLVPKIIIIRVEDGVTLVNSKDMEGIGSGFYKYEFVDADITKNYVVGIDGGVSLPKPDRFQDFGFDLVPEDLKKTLNNKTVLTKTDGKNGIEQIFKDNQTEVLKTFTYKKVGNVETRTPS